jgi:hypothetical protein
LLVIYQHNKLPKDGLSMCPVLSLGPVIVETRKVSWRSEKFE